MEFNTTLHNIKMEGGMSGWPVSATAPGPLQDKKVSQFFPWAIFNAGAGFYIPTQPGSGATPPSDLSGGANATHNAKEDDQSRPASVTVSSDSRQSVQMAPGHYNHNLHPMVAVDPVHHQHQQQPQHHQQHQHQQQSEISANQGGNISNHQPTNDTAFPGGHHRQNYNIGANQQMLQNHLNTKITGDNKGNTATMTKNKLYTEENGQVVTFNGSQEHMDMTRRGVKVERVYECKDCDKAFTREEHMKRHAKRHTDEPVHRCEVVGCTKAYTRKERLTRHYKHTHLGVEPERPFGCNVCGKDFQRKEHLTRHQKNLHGVGAAPNMLHLHQGGQNQDTDGPISMTVLNPLNTNTHHQGQHGGSNHSTQGLLHCTYEGCTKTYSRREHLNRHIKLHMGIEPERPYYCMDCAKTFTRKEHLMRHRRSHTGETPFACQDCNKQFARKEHLKRHMRVHTGEHPYPCTECGRSFGRRERLLKHLKSHGIGGLPPARPNQYQQPKTKIEFKKEPDFNADYNDHTMTHGVFGDQTNHLLRMIAQNGPIPRDHLGIAQTPPPPQNDQQTVFANPEVARALSNPEIVRAFSNPDVVKAFALSPPKKSATSPGGTLATLGQAAAQATLTTVHVSQSNPVVTRGPDIANSPSVPPELSKLPSGFSIFPVVPSTCQSGQVTGQEQTSQVCVSNNGNTYYQATPSYVTQHRTELTTIPMAAWPGWHVTASGQPVNMRSPAKVEPADSKHWEPAVATAASYFRPTFS